MPRVSDYEIWKIIGYKNQCSYKVIPSKQEKDKIRFCKNEYNATGICSQRSCPLANAKYCTVLEKEGRLYLYMKTAERAHTPALMWQRVRLSKNIEKAYAQVTGHLEFWPKHMVHRCKLRTTKLSQMLMRMRQLRTKTKQKLVTVNQKVERRDLGREAKALIAAQLQKTIKKTLLQRKETGVYGDIYNFNQEAFKSALEDVEDKAEPEEVEYDSEEEEEINNTLQYVEWEGEEDLLSDLEDLNIPGLPGASKRTPGTEDGPGPVEMEMEMEEEDTQEQ